MWREKRGKNLGVLAMQIPWHIEIMGGARLDVIVELV